MSSEAATTERPTTTHAGLIARGWQKGEPNKYLHKLAVEEWWKWVHTDGGDKAYSMSVRAYDMSRPPFDMEGLRWEYSIQLHNPVTTFNVNLVHDPGVEAAEAFFRSVYLRMECEAGDA